MRTARLKKILLAQKAFTLVELLVVIAVLAVLAAAVLVAINPVEQISRGRDSTRLAGVAQLGHTLQTYATNNSSLPNIYPKDSAAVADCPALTTATGTWMQCLVDSKELQNLVSLNAAATPCSQGTTAGKGVCYAQTATGATVWTVLESDSSKKKGGCTGGTPVPVAVWDSAIGRTGIGCLATATTTVTVNSTFTDANVKAY